MWEAVPSHHEEGESGWEGTGSSIEAGEVPVFPPPAVEQDHAVCPALLSMWGQSVHSSGTLGRGTCRAAGIPGWAE